MIKCKEFLGKPVLSLYDGTELGRVTGLVFAKKLVRLDWLLLESCGSVPASLAVKTRDILSAGSDAITVKYSDLALNTLSTPVTLADNDPSGADVYTVRGVYLGKVTDVCVAENTYLTADLATDRGEPVKLDLVATQGKNMLILQDSENPVSLAKPVSRKIKPAKVAQPAACEKVALPDKAMINFEFLIGRKTSQDIPLTGGRVLIKAGTYITAGVLATARAYGKLLDLTRNSRI